MGEEQTRGLFRLTRGRKPVTIVIDSAHRSRMETIGEFI